MFKEDQKLRNEFFISKVVAVLLLSTTP